MSDETIKQPDPEKVKAWAVQWSLKGSTHWTDIELWGDDYSASQRCQYFEKLSLGHLFDWRVVATHL